MVTFVRSCLTYGALVAEWKKVRKAGLGELMGREESRIEGCRIAQRVSRRLTRRAASRLPQLAMV